MRRFAIIAAFAAVVDVGSVGAGAVPLEGRVAYVPHDPGCESRACDVRVDRWWARHVRRHRARRVRERARLRPRSTVRWSSVEMASWFDDSGGTACGVHVSDGVANKTRPCGARVPLCRAADAGGCAGPVVVVTVEDRGPFVAGREWDLTPSAKADLGCSDLCGVREPA